MKTNLKKAAFDRETVVIAGGEFDRHDCLRAAHMLEHFPELLGALDGLLGSLAMLKSGDFVVARDSVWLDAARAARDAAQGMSLPPPWKE